jgi:hypothetical protein
MAPGKPMGRLGIQPAKAPHFGRPVMSKAGPMVRAATPKGLPAGNPTAVQGPIPVNPAGPMDTGPVMP